jgi:hypothetical protein
MRQNNLPVGNTVHHMASDPAPSHSSAYTFIKTSMTVFEEGCSVKEKLNRLEYSLLTQNLLMQHQKNDSLFCCIYLHHQ